MFISSSRRLKHNKCLNSHKNGTITTKSSFWDSSKSNFLNLMKVLWGELKRRWSRTLGDLESFCIEIAHSVFSISWRDAGMPIILRYSFSYNWSHIRPLSSILFFPSYMCYVLKIILLFYWTIFQSYWTKQSVLLL